jgi:uncharacterized protein with von Willebrand factor type A (vWA) domain
LARLRERKRKILATYETEHVLRSARTAVQERGKSVRVPGKFQKRFEKALAEEQLHELERLWYALADDRGEPARRLMRLIDALGEKYQVDELAAKYAFTGRTPLTTPEALAVKAELEKIDELIKQLEEAARTARIAVIDLDALSEFAPPEDVERLSEMARQIQEYVRELAKRQGLEPKDGRYQLSPKAYRLFQGRLLESIMSDLAPSRTGRHQGPVIGEGAVELPSTRPYEFGDSLAHCDLTASMTNALVRQGPGLPVRLHSDDLVVHRTRNTPKCATVVAMDMSGSMRYGGQYVNVKRMALAIDGLIRREYPGDRLQFLEVYSFARLLPPADVVRLLPKPVTIFDPVVRLKADMSRPEITESLIPPHFTNLQHALQLSRQYLSVQDTPNRHVILITDGLPTAHFEGSILYLLYPPHRHTEEATLREARLCAREGITINIFLLPGWSQTHEDVQFAYRLAEQARGRVFFTGGRDLDRFVVWDYVKRRRSVVG